MADRGELFDAWASSYDDDLEGAVGYPFEGYAAALDGVARTVGESGARRVLELGVGTGALTERLLGPGREVCGIDLSGAMLERARARVPAAELHRADALAAWPERLDGRTFDAVASAYLFHEFPDPTKLVLLDRLAGSAVAPGGIVAIADIAFATERAREQARVDWAERWDAGEHPWAFTAIEGSLRERGWTPAFTQVSFCAGILTLQRGSG